MTGVGARKRVLDGREHWRHLANADERLCAAATSRPAITGGDAADSQITLDDLVSP